VIQLKSTSTIEPRNSRDADEPLGGRKD